MNRRTPVSRSVWLLGLALVVAIVALGAISTVEDPSDIVNIAGRSAPFTKRTVYTVPSGETLVIRGVSVIAVDVTETFTFSAPLNLKCNNKILIPKEVMTHTEGFDPFELDDIGFKCEANKVVKLDGGPVPSTSTVGWTIIGELVSTP